MIKCQECGADADERITVGRTIYYHDQFENHFCIPCHETIENFLDEIDADGDHGDTIYTINGYIGLIVSSHKIMASTSGQAKDIYTGLYPTPEIFFVVPEGVDNWLSTLPPAFCPY